MISVAAGRRADRRHPEEDRAYFYHRATVQMDLATRAGSQEAVAAHIALAEHYMGLCDAVAMLEETREDHDGLRPIGV
ncbi:hypothetical protein [Sphingomonas sp. RS2018]